MDITRVLPTIIIDAIFYLNVPSLTHHDQPRHRHIHRSMCTDSLNQIYYTHHILGQHIINGGLSNVCKDTEPIQDIYPQVKRERIGDAQLTQFWVDLDVKMKRILTPKDNKEQVIIL
eukprot:52841_1